MFSTTTVGGVLAEQERIIIILFWMCINYAFVCGVKSDDDFLRVHRKGGAESSEKGAREQTDHRTKEGENFLRFKRELTV